MMVSLMSIGWWIIIYLSNLVFWLWVALWGGAERLDDSFIVYFIITHVRRRWEAESLKLLAWVSIIGSSIWFVMGLFLPEVRLFW